MPAHHLPSQSSWHMACQTVKQEFGGAAGICSGASGTARANPFLSPIGSGKSQRCLAQERRAAVMRQVQCRDAESVLPKPFWHVIYHATKHPGQGRQV